MRLPSPLLSPPLAPLLCSLLTLDIAEEPDLLIIMGTSLQVHGLKQLVKAFGKAVHSNASLSDDDKTSTQGPTRSTRHLVVLINKTSPASLL